MKKGFVSVETMLIIVGSLILLGCLVYLVVSGILPKLLTIVK